MAHPSFRFVQINPNHKMDYIHFIIHFKVKWRKSFLNKMDLLFTFVNITNETQCYNSSRMWYFNVTFLVNARLGNCCTHVLFLIARIASIYREGWALSPMNLGDAMMKQVPSPLSPSILKECPYVDSYLVQYLNYQPQI